MTPFKCSPLTRRRTPLHLSWQDFTALIKDWVKPNIQMSKFDTFCLHWSCYPSIGHATVVWLVEGTTLTQKKWTKLGLIQRDMITKKVVRGREARNKIRSIKVLNRFQHASLNRPIFCYRSSTIGGWCQRLKFLLLKAKHHYNHRFELKPIGIGQSSGLLWCGMLWHRKENSTWTNEDVACDTDTLFPVAVRVVV